MFKQALIYVIVLMSTVLAVNVSAGGHMGLMVMDAQARAMPPGAKNSAAYFTLMNHKKQNLTLVSAQSDVAEVTEFHDHFMIDGAMSMRQVANVKLPAGGNISFQPSGLHVMLIGLKKPLKPGSLATITLQFKNGESLVVEAEIVMPDEIIEAPQTMAGMHDKHVMPSN